MVFAGDEGYGNDDDGDAFGLSGREGFMGYVQHTVDPGRSMVLLVCIFCALAQLALLFLVAFQRRRERIRLLKERVEGGAEGEEGGGDAYFNATGYSRTGGAQPERPNSARGGPPGRRAKKDDGGDDDSTALDPEGVGADEIVRSGQGGAVPSVSPSSTPMRSGMGKDSVGPIAPPPICIGVTLCSPPLTMTG